MTVCARCHRALLREPVYVGGMPMGPKCATAVAGPRPRTRRAALFDYRRPRGDARQRDLFNEATS